MEERHPETSFDALGAPWVNGGSLPVGQIRNVPGQRRESPEESADADRESIETSSEPPAEATPSVNGSPSAVSRIGIASTESPELSEESADADRESIETSSEPPAEATPSVNGSPSAVSRIGIASTESPELSEESADADRESIETSSEPPAEPNNLATGASHLPDGSSDSLSETDWETTRYLAVATQLNLRYARFVVSQIIGEPFRAVAPAAGADVVIVTRWALAALRRRAWRDGTLAGLLVIGAVASIWGWTWIPVVVVAVLAILVVAYEQWVCDVKVLARLMLRGRFRARHAPLFSSPRIEARLAVVQRQQKGNLIVSQGRSAFVGSGQNVVHDRIIVNVARGKKGKGGKRQPPVPFSTLQLHGALEKALKNMDFPELRVGQQLHVNGEHVAADPRLLPEALGPPVADAPSGLLDEGCIHPTPEARTYVCAEISGWKGQLVVSLFTRAVQVHGSLQVEWMFYVLPPLNTNLLLIDQQYEPHRIKQVTKAIGSGIRHFVPDLLSAPVTFTQYAVRPVADWFRIRSQSYRIRNGHVFNYGSPPSIRENAISHRRQHDFVIGDERTFILLARHTMLRALRKFLKAHKIDMKQFSDQEQTIIKKINKYKVGKVKAKHVAVGNKSRASGGKNKSGS